MSISPNNPNQRVAATDVRFSGDVLFVSLSDGREIGVPLREIRWLNWLADASPEERRNWSIEPGGFAIYWEELDDGIEVCHLLAQQPLVRAPSA